MKEIQVISVKEKKRYFAPDTYGIHYNTLNQYHFYNTAVEKTHFVIILLYLRSLMAHSIKVKSTNNCWARRKKDNATSRKSTEQLCSHHKNES